MKMQRRAQACGCCNPGNCPKYDLQIPPYALHAAEKAAAVSEASTKSLTLPKDNTNVRRLSRFEVTPVPQQSIDGRSSPPPSNRMSPNKTPVKSILKHTVSFTYSPHSTVTLTGQGMFIIHIFHSILTESESKMLKQIHV